MITICLSYYENGGMLERHLTEWASYRLDIAENFGAVIVDDGSPKDPAANHRAGAGPAVKFYRIKQNIIWNVAGARNLAMHVAPDGWCLLTDIDHLLKADDADILDALLPRLDPTKVYVPSRRWADGRPLHQHPNSYVMQRAIYWRVGGCDEDWSGWWGAGENVFRKKLATIAATVSIPNVYLTHFGRDDIADASTREWGRRKSKYDWTNNPVLVAKHRAPPYTPKNPLRFEWEKVE
jgi:hypothetical protein